MPSRVMVTPDRMSQLTSVVVPLTGVDPVGVGKSRKPDLRMKLELVELPTTDSPTTSVKRYPAEERSPPPPETTDSLMLY
jgi:hypothetical protein